ncbi:MAG TPA: S26 family signal peptidase [Caulobacteraceae bacterium]|nr:S26 family signal peptidase [Caulobacteraceae bacterium]
MLATAASSLLRPQTLLINTTPSEPIGLYHITGETPAVGRIIAFKVPSTAFPYADRHLPYLRRVPLLKAIAAAAGDRVCTTTGRLVIDGRDRAAIARVDGEGRALPRWIACRTLAPGEVFVFSSRVPNSFDSRYFGPVSRPAVEGVFAPTLLIRTHP